MRTPKYEIQGLTRRETRGKLWNKVVGTISYTPTAIHRRYRLNIRCSGSSCFTWTSDFFSVLYIFQKMFKVISRSFMTSRALLETKITGRVKWFDSQKGFGFITPSQDSGRTGDIFVHQSNIVSATGYRTLAEEMEVSFFARPDKAAKEQAYEVTAVDGSPVKASDRPSSSPARDRAFRSNH